MKPTIALSALAILLLLARPLEASDACSNQSISTHADVTVSDGQAYQVISHYHAPNAAAARFVSDTVRTVTVEGPYAWNTVQAGGETTETLGAQAHKVFALGHQFHALFLRFDDIMTDIKVDRSIPFQGQTLMGRIGTYPHGGTAQMIDADDDGRVSGMRFVFPGTGPIEAVFENWRHLDGRTVPYRIIIHHEGRAFDYAFRSVDITEKSPLWFMDTVKVPNLNEIEIYRLHRKLLAAHCIGDGGMMERLTAPETLMANRGVLMRGTAKATGERFGTYFKGVRYTEYIDLKEPVIEVAKSGDLGWMGVNVRAKGEEIASGSPFNDEWAWIMLVKKIDGKWLNAGNASSIKSK